MSAVPALIAVQIALSASSSSGSIGSYGVSTRRSGFRSLSDRGLDLKGWRSTLYSAFVVLCIIASIMAIIATMAIGLAGSIWVATTFSALWLLATVPAAIAAVLGAFWLMFRLIID